MNLFLSRLDEQQRRWYVALEAKKMGHGGAKRMSQITGMNVETIRRGRRELENSLTVLLIVSVYVVAGGIGLKKRTRHRKGTRSIGGGGNRWRPKERQKRMHSSLRQMSKSLRKLKKLNYSLKANGNDLLIPHIQIETVSSDTLNG